MEVGLGMAVEVGVGASQATTRIETIEIRTPASRDLSSMRHLLIWDFSFETPLALQWGQNGIARSLAPVLSASNLGGRPGPRLSTLR